MHYKKEESPLSKRIIGCAAIVAFFFVPIAEGKEQLSPLPSLTISLDVTEAYLEDVLKLLSKQSGLNFVASEDVKDKKVTTYLEKVPVQAAVETILTANHLSLKPVGGNNLFIVVPSDAPKVETTTKIFHLKYARVIPSAGDVYPIFGLTGSLITQSIGTTTGGTTGGNTVGVGGLTGGGIGVGGGIGGGIGGGGIPGQ